MSEARAVPQRISHVALSLPRSGFDDSLREALRAFYGDVFGWSEIESLRREDRLTLRVSDNAYLNVRARDEPMRSSGYEHFGVWIDAPEDFDALCDRARAWARRDAGVSVEELEPVEAGKGSVHNVRIRFRLPMAVEVQCFKRG